MKFLLLKKIMNIQNNLSKQFQEILLLQQFLVKNVDSNNQNMKRRGEILKASEKIIESYFTKKINNNNSEAFSVKSSNQQGRYSEVPWIRIYQEKFSPSPQKGYYLVFLFDYGGDGNKGNHIYLSLNQGTENQKEIEIKHSSSYARKYLNIPDNKINLNGSGRSVRPKKYESGNIQSIQYNFPEIPSDESIFEDIMYLIENLMKLYDLNQDDIKIKYDLDEIDNNTNISSTEKRYLSLARVGQGKYREDLINYWKGCSVTNISNTDLLIASHIKPWRESNKEERLSKFNGLLLTPNLDKLFDKGYISFADSGKILISNKISTDEMLSLGISKGMRLKFSPSDTAQIYLKIHREKIFIS